MTSAPICAWCKQPTKGLAAIGDDHYCHEGDSPTCYESAQSFLALNAGQMSRAGSFLDGLLDQQHRQWQERHGDPTLAGAQAFERLRDDQRRDAARDFANWVATQRAYNGSEHERGQSLYNECINAVLPTWAEEWAAEQATSAPAQPDDGSNRLRDEEAEQILRAADDPNLPDDVFDVIEQILAARLAEAVQELDGWKRAYEVTDRRVTGHVQERVTLVQRLHAAEQERDLATATAADAVAKLDRLHDLLAEPAESRAGLLAQRMIRDALDGKETS